MNGTPPTRVPAAEARNSFAEILGRAFFGRETFLIEKQGKPFAVVLGIDEYRRLLSHAEDPDRDRGRPGGSGNPE